MPAAHVVIEHYPGSMIAYASDRRLSWRTTRPPARAYHAYLRARIGQQRACDRSLLGFAARAFQEAVIIPELHPRRGVVCLARSCRRRYRIDLDESATLPTLTGA